METDKNALDQRDGFPIMRQVGKISLSFFPAHNSIMALKGRAAAAARLFSSSTFGEGGVRGVCVHDSRTALWPRRKEKKGAEEMEKVKRYEIEGTALDIPMHWDERSQNIRRITPASSKTRHTPSC